MVILLHGEGEEVEQRGEVVEEVGEFWDGGKREG